MIGPVSVTLFDVPIAISLSFWPCRSRDAIAAKGVGKLVLTVNSTIPAFDNLASIPSEGLEGNVFPGGVGGTRKLAVSCGATSGLV